MDNNYQNKILILTPTYNYLKELQLFLKRMLIILDQTRYDVRLVILDNNSKQPIKDYLKTQINANPRLKIEFLATNYGKANAINQWLKQNLSQTNYPDILISLDPDILFSLNSFEYFVEAALNIPNLGVLGMRYVKNSFNPERNLWFPAKTVYGENNRIYKIKIPFLANVAGGILAIKGSFLADKLNFVLYDNPDNYVYYGDDVALWQKVKHYKLIFGYLNKTNATHLKSVPIEKF